LTEDEDIQRMLRGSLLRKIKSRRVPRERLFRLQEDGVTVCFEGRFRGARSPQSFSVLHVEGVREGHQSEGLRKYGAAFPERHCFTVVFKGKRKNLDLAARGEEDACHWVRGLTKLTGRLQAMSQPEKLEQYPFWIHGVLQRADRNKDNKMSFREVKNMLRMINIDMDDVYAYKLFKECDHSGTERLEGRGLELEELFGRYSGEDRVLSAEELRDFLRDQGEDASLRQARAIIRTYELNEKARQQDLMMLDGFMMYLLSAAGDILNQEHTKVHQDMSQPLCHYFISSSHNTYLTRNQIGGTSSTEAYVRWVPLGRSMPGRSRGCGVPGTQALLVRWQGTDGGMPLPWPFLLQQLKGKVLVKGKKLPEPWHEPQSVTSLLEPEEEEEEEEEYEEEEKVQERNRRQVRGSPRDMVLGDRGILAKDASQVSPELSAVVVYCQAVPFPGLAHALRHPRPCAMSSFSERKARKLIKEAG
ncbi:PLCD3 phosphodiesterase, partial [Chloroceryle aenea]|nr:PLCD3 phosphodiesterase [Chloroceryle aenea]